MSRFLAVSLFFVSVAACQKKDPPPRQPATKRPAASSPDAAAPPTRPVQKERKAGPPPRVAAGAAAFACQQNTDCVRTCMKIGSCCGQLCGCTNVWSRRFYERLQALQRQYCRPKSFSCPVASCTAPTVSYQAVCKAGKCALQTTPLKRRATSPPKLPEGPDAYACRKDTDCVKTCTVNGSCCGQLCSCTKVYSRVFYKRLQAHQRRHCMPPRPRCPVASCPYPQYKYSAVCKSGKCAIKATKRRRRP